MPYACFPGAPEEIGTPEKRKRRPARTDRRLLDVPVQRASLRSIRPKLWAPGYYYVLFEDPDGIRLEVNHIPGKGVFAAGGKIAASEDYIRVGGKDITEVPG